MTPVEPRHLRIFMASPGDVTHERELALTVLDQLPYEPSFRGLITVQEVAWDKKGAGAPILANMTPQDSIKLGLPTPAECDIVVVIFWARMGTPLPQQYLKADGSRYLSGTEWEYENAIEASEKGDGPTVLLYRRKEPLLLNPDDPEFEEKTNQYRLVKRFFDSLVEADGSIKRGYNTYKTPSDFKEALELHLKSIIERLIRNSKSVPNSIQTVPPAWPTSPFPGLRAFKAADAPIFFGRERETDSLVKRVEENPVVAVVGASGSGKSSLVGAGLIPRLLLTTGNEGWLPITTTPDYLGSGNPFAALAASLLRDVGPIDQPELAIALSKDANLLTEIFVKALQQHPPQAKVLLFIDQFEELFTTIAPSYRMAYVDTLVKAASYDQVRMVLTLRGDFYGKCVELPQLAKLLEESTCPLSVPGIAALYEMITRPASRADLQFEDGLAQRILTDTGDEPGSLALMAYTLDELYRASVNKSTLLTHSAYEELGGVQGAIGKRSETVFLRLDEKIRAALPHVFRELVEVDERGTATRQRTSLNRAAKTKEAATLISALTEARLLVQSRGENNEPFVEVAHEALLRSWERLAEWIKDTQDDLRLLRQVRIAAREWDENGRRDDFLWSQERLEPVYAMRDRLGVEFESTVSDFIRPEVERLLDEFKSHRKYFEQRQVIQRFSELGTLSIPCAVQALPHAVVKSAKRDLYELLSKYPSEAVPILVNNLSTADVTLRTAITEVLASEFPTLTVASLAKMAKDNDPHIRARAVAGLGASAHLPSIQVLQDTLSDPDVWVRRISAIELASFGVREIVQPLLSVLHDKTDEIRPLTAHLIGLLGNVDPEKWPSYYSHRARSLVASSGETEKFYSLVEQAICRADGALSRQLPSEALEALIHGLSEGNDELRKNCAKALGMIADPSVIPALSAELKDTNAEFVLIVIQAIGNVSHVSAIPALRQALSSDFGDVRAAAATLLGELSNRKPSREDRVADAMIDSSTIAHLLVVLESDEDVRVRRRAALSIGQIGSRAAIPALLKAARHKDPQLRANAIMVLGNLGDRSAVPTLVNALTDGASDVQTNAIRGLGQLGDPSIIPNLLELLAPLENRELDYWEQQFKITIIRTLGELKDNSSLPALERALFSSDKKVSSAARTALYRLDTPEAQELLRTF